MDTAEDVKQIQAAAEKLQRTLKIKLDGGLQGMKAVQERLELYNRHSNSFSTRIFEHLKKQFEDQAQHYAESRNRSSPTSSRKQNAITAGPHRSIEDNLIKYSGFALWEKEMEPRMYNELQRHYAQTMSPLYEQDIRELMDAVRPFYTTLRNRGSDELDYSKWETGKDKGREKRDWLARQVFKHEESRPVRALAYGASLRNEESRAHRYRQMLRGSVEGVMGSGSGAGRNSMDEDERAADDVSWMTG